MSYDLRTLSNLEKELASQTQVAASNAALARYQAEELSSSLSEAELALVQQGFDAGYMRAMRKVLSTITEMKAVEGERFSHPAGQTDRWGG